MLKEQHLLGILSFVNFSICFRTFYFLYEGWVLSRFVPPWQKQELWWWIRKCMTYLHIMPLPYVLLLSSLSGVMRTQYGCIRESVDEGDREDRFTHILTTEPRLNGLSTHWDRLGGAKKMGGWLCPGSHTYASFHTASFALINTYISKWVGLSACSLSKISYGLSSCLSPRFSSSELSFLSDFTISTMKYLKPLFQIWKQIIWGWVSGSICIWKISYT